MGDTILYELFVMQHHEHPYPIQIIQMNRGLFSALSALTLATGTAAYYFWKNLNHNSPSILPRLAIKNALVTLRKRAYSTLREIAFIVSSIRTLQGDLEVKKINEVFMRDGGSGEKKLQAIEALVLKEEKIEQKDFEHSCTYYSQHDLEIRMLLQTFKKDLNMALEGVMETFHGPLPHFPPQTVLHIQSQLIKRRMSIIENKQIWGRSDEQCLRDEAHMYMTVQAVSQEYLSEEGVRHEKQPNEKIWISVLEHHYRSDAEFKERFEQLEMQMELFIIEVQNRCRQRKEGQEERERGKEGQEERGRGKEGMSEKREQYKQLREEEQEVGQKGMKMQIEFDSRERM